MQLKRKGPLGRMVGALTVLALAGCQQVPGSYEQPWEKANLVQGPPIEDIVTAFDSALGCLRGKIKRNVVFAVGQVSDNTGKETYNDGGSGKLVTQGASDMVQSALFRAGVTVVNRSQVNVSVIEATWGIRDIKSQVPVNFYISGSVNSLDYIPGGGYSVEIAGFGPKKRQSRIMVGLDLSMVDAFTGRVVASIPLQKQIYMREAGVSGSAFFGDTLVSLDAGGMEREAMNFALRQMVSLATFELLGQVMNQGVYSQCRVLVPGDAGAVEHNGTADRMAVLEASAGADLMVPVTPAMPAPPVPQGGPQPGGAVDPSMLPQQSPEQGAEPAPGADPQGKQNTPREDASLLGKEAAKTATRAIGTAKKSYEAETIDLRMKMAAEAVQLANLALKLLQEAAKRGLDGDEGDVAAVVVQEAMKVATTAGKEAADAARAAQVKPAPAPAPVAPAPAPQKQSSLAPAPGAPIKGQVAVAAPAPAPVQSIMRLPAPTNMFVEPGPVPTPLPFVTGQGG